MSNYGNMMKIERAQDRHNIKRRDKKLCLALVWDSYVGRNRKKKICY